jgi:alkaline phosphatase
MVSAGGAVFALESRLLFGEERPEAPCVRAGIVTDVHYCDIPPAGSRHYEASARKLREAVGVMNRVKPDFMIELGDFKDQSRDRDSTLKCLEYIESVYAGFKGDRFHVQGNHEFDCLSSEDVFSRTPNAGKICPKGYYSFERGPLTFIVLDGCYTSGMKHYGSGVKWKWTDANIPPEEIAWLEGVLEKAKKAVVFCHQRIDSKPRAHHGLKNAAQIREILKRSGKVKSVLTGHDHIGGISVEDGITYYTLHAMIEGPGNEDNSYAVASFYEDGTMSVRGWHKAKTLNR